MFSNNEKISLRQLKRLLVFDLFSVSGLIIPRIAVGTAGKDGILAIILATLYAFLYAFIIISFSKSTGGKFLDYSDKYLGKILTFPVGLLYITKLFVCCVFAVRLFGEVINETLLKDTDPRVIIILLLIVSAYAASKGFEVRARITEVLYFIVIIPIFIFLILGLSKIELSNLMPLFTRSVGSIAVSGYDVFLTFSILELLLFSAPLIKFKNTDIHRGKRLYHYVGQALFVVGIINVLLFVLTMGILGQGETQQKIWSMVNVIQVIKMPGGFIQRQDAIILGIWMLSIFTLISAFFYYIGLISKHIFRIPKLNVLLIPYILLIFGASAIPVDIEQFFYYFELYMKYIGFPQSILLPIIVIFIGWVKTRSEKSQKSSKTIIKTLLLLITMVSSVTLSGCGDMTEIEDRNFIQAIGIDVKDNEIITYYVLPDLKALTEQGSEDPEKLELKLTGHDYWQIEESYNLENNKRLDFSHLKAIIIGKSIANNKEQLEEFLTYIENKYEIGRNTLVFLSDEDAKDIISLSGDLEGGIGDYLDRLYRINLSNSGKEEITIGDMILSMNEGNYAVSMQILKAKEKRIEIIGLGIFEDSHLAYTADAEISDFLDFANGYGKNKILYLPKDSKDNATQYVVRINNFTRNVKYTWENDKPFLSLRIEGIGIIEKGYKDTGKISEKTDVDIIEEIEARCNEVIKKGIEDSFKELIKDKNLDYINLYRMTSYKNKKMWLQYENNEKLFLKDLDYNIEIDLKMH